MGFLSEAAKFGRAASPPKEPVAVDIDREGTLALTRFVERTQQIETAWFAIARTATNRMEALEHRARRIEKLACLAGGIGLLGVVAAQFYRLVPYEYAFAMTMIGVAFAAAPLVPILWPALKENEFEKATLLESSVRARAKGGFTKRMAQAAEQARLRAVWTADVRKPLEWLLEDMEAEVGKTIAELGVTGIEGRKHRRIVPRQRKVIVQTRDGRSLTGLIADLSLSGLALSEQLPRVAVKEEVLVNGRAATIVRIWSGGVALEFKTHLDSATFNENLVL